MTLCYAESNHSSQWCASPCGYHREYFTGTLSFYQITVKNQVPVDQQADLQLSSSDWTIWQGARTAVSVMATRAIWPSCTWAVGFSSRPVAQIPQCTRPITHNTAFCNRNVPRNVGTFRIQNGVLWDIFWSIEGFVRWFSSPLFSDFHKHWRQWSSLV